MKVTLNHGLKALSLSAVLCLSAGFMSQALAQDAGNEAEILENIRPVGSVCLAGQDCTGDMRTAAANTATTASDTSAPAAPAAVASAAEPAFDVAATYQMTCFACHGTGAAGAPKTGDSAAWEPRIAKGMDVVIANAMNGFNVMPAKGMCMTCTETNIRSLVDYMLNPN